MDFILLALCIIALFFVGYLLWESKKLKSTSADLVLKTFKTRIDLLERRLSEKVSWDVGERNSKEIQKLKAVVAEVCDYVYGDEK